MTTAVTAVFLLTYALIVSRRLRLLPIGRPAGALVGAVLMISIGALSPVESYEAIDHDTIVLLFGTMALTVYLERAGFFDWLAIRMISICPTGISFLFGTVLLSGALSALLVNDTVCLFLTPVIISACRTGGLPMGPYLIALATSANIGSAATLVGNPQNMIIGSMSGFSFSSFFLFAGPAAAAGLIVNSGLLWVYYRRQLTGRMLKIPPTNGIKDRRRFFLTLLVTGGVIAGFFAGLHLGYTAVAGAVILVVADRRDPRDVFSRVDWSLLLFFCCLFIVVAGLAKTGIIERAWGISAPYFVLSETSGLASFSALVTFGSNLISNVPMVMLTGPHLHELGSVDLGWVLLAFVSTIAGNLTLLGSVANIIVAERAREDYTLGFREYLRFGAPSTVLVMIVGVCVIYFLMR
ncbi:MAG: anion transporter [Deltaproteobacteria bacterium HGW-Deltaproteobacteria-15]|nr:MAG: anion transporter [Deltaproteobacteria bacterium HGW-Deltaproteobacteria-15]